MPHGLGHFFPLLSVQQRGLALYLVSPQVNSSIPNILAKSIFAGRRGDTLHHGDAFLENGGGEDGLGAWECKQNLQGVQEKTLL